MGISHFYSFTYLFSPDLSPQTNVGGISNPPYFVLNKRLSEDELQIRYKLKINLDEQAWHADDEGDGYG